jgi:hypothetical protein
MSNCCRVTTFFNRNATSLPFASATPRLKVNVLPTKKKSVSANGQQQQLGRRLQQQQQQQQQQQVQWRLFTCTQRTTHRSLHH